MLPAVGGHLISATTGREDGVSARGQRTKCATQRFAGSHPAGTRSSRYRGIHRLLDLKGVVYLSTGKASVSVPCAPSVTAADHGSPTERQ
jgi:hypothetical protein